MEEKVKRGGISALIMSLMAPGAGLVYLHRPLRALICALVFLLALAGDAVFHTFSTMLGLCVSLGVGAFFWLFGVLSVMVLSGRGLTVAEAKRDVGVWVVLLSLLNITSLALFLSLPYSSYTVPSIVIRGLEPGDNLLVIGGQYDAERNALGRERLVMGDVVVGEEKNTTFISRIWGIPGDVLELREGMLYRNGQQVTEAAGITLPNQDNYWVVPGDAVFLWNDALEPDPGHGAKYAGVLRGKALFVYWSQNRDRLGKVIE